MCYFMCVFFYLILCWWVPSKLSHIQAVCSPHSVPGTLPLSEYATMHSLPVNVCRHLGCFWGWALTNSTLINIRLRVSCCRCDVLFLLGTCLLEVEFLGLRKGLLLNLVVIAKHCVNSHSSPEVYHPIKSQFFSMWCSFNYLKFIL